MTQPGAYTLYNSSYVVESETSHIPDIQPVSRTPAHATRRARYLGSPHVYANEECSSLQPNVNDKEVESGGGGDGGGVKVSSLFDVLGSAARRPARNRWRAEKNVVLQPPVLNRAGEKGGADVSTFGMALSAALFFALAMYVLLSLDARARARGRGGGYVTDVKDVRDVRDKGNRIGMGAFVMDVCTRVRGTGSKMWESVGWRGGEHKPIESGVIKDEGDLSREEVRAMMLSEVVATARRAGAAAGRAAGEEAVRNVRGGGEVGRRENKEMIEDVLKVRRESLEELMELYAGDKGMSADYALESAGGRVIHSEPSLWDMRIRYAKDVVIGLISQRDHDVAFPRRPANPQMVLQADVLPGNCWWFDGHRGSITIRLGRATIVESISVEHTPRNSVFDTNSAMNKFEVYAVFGGSDMHGREDILLGRFHYCMSDTCKHLQTFQMQNVVKRMTNVVKIEVLSNHGAEHTAVYRIRVHSS